MKINNGVVLNQKEGEAVLADVERVYNDIQYVQKILKEKGLAKEFIYSLQHGIERAEFLSCEAFDNFSDKLI